MSKPSLFCPADELALVVGQELAEAFVRMRKAIRKPITEDGARFMANRLRKFDNPMASVEQSVRNSWLDCYEVKPDRQQLQHRPLRGVEALAENLRQEIESGQHRGTQSPDPQAGEQLRLERQQFH